MGTWHASLCFNMFIHFAYIYSFQWSSFLENKINIRRTCGCMVLRTILRMARWLTKGLILNFFKKTETKISTHTPSPYHISLDQNNVNTKHVVERASIFFFFLGKGGLWMGCNDIFLSLPLGRLLWICRISFCWNKKYRTVVEILSTVLP